MYIPRSTKTRCDMKVKAIIQSPKSTSFYAIATAACGRDVLRCGQGTFFCFKCYWQNRIVEYLIVSTCTCSCTSFWLILRLTYFHRHTLYKWSLPPIRSGSNGQWRECLIINYSGISLNGHSQYQSPRLCSHLTLSLIQYLRILPNVDTSLFRRAESFFRPL